MKLEQSCWIEFQAEKHVDKIDGNIVESQQKLKILIWCWTVAKS